PLWGSEDHLRGLFGERVGFESLERDVLEVSAFAQPGEFGDHFRQRYGPTIVTRANAEREGKLEQLDQGIDRFCSDWNLGSDENARFELEYLLAVGTRAGGEER
ncbi:MAG TPA: SAM-dependent methyltransferase, partial [Solirubrobacterales bacterium]|nr:SAM-dependent methyltransferase [Solirubrobacterales bacterium]